MRGILPKTITGLATAALVLAAPGAWAQIGAGFYAPPDAMDELSGAPVGGGGTGQVALDRARGLQQQPPSMMYDDPAMGAFDQYTDPAMGFTQYPGDPWGFGPPGQFGQQQQMMVEPEPDTLVAWGGERIFCQRTGVMLQDAREIRILAEHAGAYYDDGETGHDAVADDNIYTNITISREWVSPESQLVRTRLIRALELAEELDAREFALLPVATTEPRNPFPKMQDLAVDKDTRMRNWIDTFLREYRIDPADPDSEMYRTYLPVPPRAPNIPMPMSFTPHMPEPEEFDQFQQGLGPAGFGGGFDPAMGGMGGGAGAGAAYF